jgi:hypothetical protein
VRRLALALAAFAALASPISVHAQAPEPLDAAHSLKCAMWASYYVAEYQGQDEEAVFVRALNYFVGRYEGLTGHGIDTATDEKLIGDAANEIDALTPACMGAMLDYGERMVDWSRILDKISRGLPAEQAGPSS